MAIKPNQIPAFADSDKMLADDLEKVIDEWLKNYYPKGRQYWTVSSVRTIVPQRVLEELVRRYRAAGWTCDIAEEYTEAGIKHFGRYLFFHAPVKDETNG